MPWSVGLGGVTSTVNGSIAGTTGISLPFASNGGAVTAGDVIAVASLWFQSSGTSFTPTFTDTSSNVTTWNTTGNFSHSVAINGDVAISWGIATSTGACTPKVVWSDASAGDLELYIGDFVSPGGTVSQDGALAVSDNTSNATCIVPAANGVGASDLLINMMGFGTAANTVVAPWVALGPAQGDQAAYLLNGAGNATPDQTQTGTATFVSIILALSAAGGAATLSISEVN